MRSLIALAEVTVSEMAYGFQARGGAQSVLDAVDFLDIHMLPFFSHQASTGTLSSIFNALGAREVDDVQHKTRGRS